MQACAISFFAGVLSIYGFSQPDLLAFFFAFIMFLCAWLWYRPRHHFLFLIPLFFFAGSMWIQWNVYLVNSRTISQRLENRKIRIVGDVVSGVVGQGHRQRFVIQTQNVDGKKIKIKIRLTNYDPFDVKAGQRWQLLVKLKRPRGLLNPGGRDFEAYLFRERINAVGYVVKSSVNHKLQDKQCCWLLRYRIELAKRLILQYQGQAQGLMIALGLGFRHYLSPQIWQLFQQTMTGHLIAISGLHIGLLSSCMYLLISGLWRLSKTLSEWIIAQRVAACGATLVAFWYASLAGFSIATQRAAVMVALLMLGQLCMRRVCPWKSLSIALFFSLICDPLAIMNQGFWLSFYTVFVLIFTFKADNFRPNLLLSLGKTQLVIGLAMLPWTLYLNQQVLPFGSIFNLIAIPLMSLFILPSLMLGLFMMGTFSSVAHWSLKVSGLCLDFLVFFLRQGISWFGQFDFSFIPISLVDLLLTLLGVLILIAPAIGFYRLLSLFFLIPLLWNSSQQLARGDYSTHLFDVGQGLAVLIKTKNHVLLYDTAAHHKPAPSVAKNILLPYLKQNQIKRLDVLVISHGDNDHSGGFNDIVQSLEVDKIISSVRMRSTNSVLCSAHQRWHWDGVDFQMLYPPLGQRYVKNNSSCVLRISNGNYSLLLPGDIEKKAELELMRTNTQNLNADVLIAPHHGSQTSSTPGFIRSVKAQYVLYSTGYLNRYGFPHRQVVRRYAQHKTKQYSTAQCGYLGLFLPKQGKLTLDCYRQQHKPFWRSK